MENKLYMARYQVDNIVHTIEQLLRGVGQRGMAQAPQQQQQPPVLTLAERNTEVYMQKMQEQAALQKDQQSMDKEAAAAAAANGDIHMTDAPKQQASDDAPLSAEDELAEFLHDEDAEDGAGDEVSTIADPLESIAGGVSLATRRNRLGTLLMLKRRQYTQAKDVLMSGIEQLRASIESERKYLEGVGELAKYWTVRTVPNDAAAAVHLPSTSAAAAAHAAQQGKGPLLNPYQAGLPAGFTTAYPSLMIDYRIGTRESASSACSAWRCAALRCEFASYGRLIVLACVVWLCSGHLVGSRQSVAVSQRCWGRVRGRGAGKTNRHAQDEHAITCRTGEYKQPNSGGRSRGREDRGGGNCCAACQCPRVCCCSCSELAGGVCSSSACSASAPVQASVQHADDRSTRLAGRES